MTTDTKNTTATDARKPWIVPAVQKMQAGDAELGANPNVPEGSFGKGS